MLPQNFIDDPNAADDDGMNTKYSEEDMMAKPVLGLNLKDYFLKRHLVDQPPVEPLPPIENPLEMTQNHEDWVRGQEDFKINHEKTQQLQPNNANGRPEFQSIADVNNSAGAFQIEIQKEIAQFHDSVPSVSFDIKSWETLT